jgi:glycosidase
MKLILDWVPNHTAWDHVWVRDHPDFYVRDERGAMTVPRDDKGKLTDWTDVAQLDYRNPAMRSAMIEAMRYWLTEFGVDGFRVDVAGFVPDAFWREAAPALRSAVPRPILLSRSGAISRCIGSASTSPTGGTATPPSRRSGRAGRPRPSCSGS